MNGFDAIIPEALRDRKFQFMGSSQLGIQSPNDIDICVLCESAEDASRLAANLTSLTEFPEFRGYAVPFDWGGKTFLRMLNDIQGKPKLDIFLVDKKTYLIIEKVHQFLMTMRKSNLGHLLEEKNTRVFLFQYLAERVSKTEKEKEKQEKLTVIYARCSTAKQKENFMVKEIRKFLTDDGREFNTEEEASYHEKECGIKSWYEENKILGNREGSTVEWEHLINWLRKNISKFDDIHQLAKETWENGTWQDCTFGKSLSSSLDRASKNVQSSWPQWKQQVAGADLYSSTKDEYNKRTK